MTRDREWVSPCGRGVETQAQARTSGRGGARRLLARLSAADSCAAFHRVMQLVCSQIIKPVLCLNSYQILFILLQFHREITCEILPGSDDRWPQLQRSLHPTRALSRSGAFAALRPQAGEEVRCSLGTRPLGGAQLAPSD